MQMASANLFAINKANIRNNYKHILFTKTCSSRRGEILRFRLAVDNEDYSSEVCVYEYL